MPPEYQGTVCDPTRQCGVSKNVTVPATDAWHGMYQNYTVGVGGACDRYDPPYSPWCSGDFYSMRQFLKGAALHTRSPAGIHAAAHLPNSAHYSADAHEHATIHAWRPGHWFTWMFNLSKAVVPALDKKGVAYRFASGGHQGGEGHDRGGEWFIEGVLEELDAPNEFFHDAAKRQLHYRPNASGAPPDSEIAPPDAEIVVPSLATFISILGSQKQPAVNPTGFKRRGSSCQPSSPRSGESQPPQAHTRK